MCGTSIYCQTPKKKDPPQTVADTFIFHGLVPGENENDDPKEPFEPHGIHRLLLG